MRAWREPDPALVRRDIGLAYFDLYYYLISAVILMKSIIRGHEVKLKAEQDLQVYDPFSGSIPASGFAGNAQSR